MINPLLFGFLVLTISSLGFYQKTNIVALSYLNNLSLNTPESSKFHDLVADEVEQPSHPDIFLMKDKEVKVAVLINLDMFTFVLPSKENKYQIIDSSFISQNVDELNKLDYSYIMTEVLNKECVPFLINYLYIEVFERLIYIEDLNENNYEVNLAKLEYPDHGDLKNYASQLYKMGIDLETKLSKLYEIFFYISHTIGLANHKQVLHGNICPENILLRNCSLGKFEVCPIIAGWDMSFNIKIPSNYMKYTPRYRPLEMTLFQDVNMDEIYTAPGRYKYSKTEDGYAFAITMIDTMIAAGISKEQMQGVTTMLNGLLYPWTVEEVFELHINSVEELMSKSDIVEKFDKILNPEYIETIRRLNNIIKSSQDEIINKDIDMLKRMSALKHPDGSSVAAIRYYIESTRTLEENNYDDIIGRLDKSQADEFMKLKQELREHNVFNDAHLSRKNMGQVSKYIFLLILPEYSEKSNNEIEQLVKNEIIISRKYFLNEYKAHDGLYSQLKAPHNSSTLADDIFMEDSNRVLII